MNTHEHNPIHSSQNSVLKIAQNLVPLSRTIFGNGIISSVALNIAYKVEKATSSKR